MLPFSIIQTHIIHTASAPTDMLPASCSCWLVRFLLQGLGAPLRCRRRGAVMRSFLSAYVAVATANCSPESSKHLLVTPSFEKALLPYYHIPRNTRGKKNASGPTGKKERRRISFLPLVRWKRLRKSKNAANTWVVQIIWIHHCLFSQLRGMIENICGPNLCQTASQNRTMKKHYVRNALRRYQKHDLKHDWKAVPTWSSFISVTGFQPYDFLGLTWIAASNTLSDWKHHVPEKIVALMFAIKWRVWNGVNSGSPSFSAVFPALSAVFPPFSAVAFLLCFAFFCVLFWLMRLLERLCATLHSLLLTSHEMQENPACKQKQ